MTKLETITEKLNTIYDRVSNIPNLKQLMLSVYEYIEVFDTNSELTPINDAIKKMSHEDTKHIKDLEKKALQETETAYKSIKAYLIKENISEERVLNEITNYEGSVAGTYRSSLGKLRERHGSLCYALMSLVESDLQRHLDFCRKHGVIKDDGRILNWNFSPSYEKWEDATEKMKRQEQTKVWFSWDKLVTFYQVYKDYEDIQSSYIRDGKVWDVYGLSMLYEEIKTIMEGKEPNTRTHREYVLEDYKIHLERVHTYVKAFLSTTTTYAPPVITGTYNANTLNIANKTVAFRQGLRKTLMNFLMKTDKSKRTRYLFADIHKEIGDSTFNTQQGNKKLWEACKGINQQIATKTGVIDFLKYDTLEVQINPDYLL